VTDNNVPGAFKSSRIRWARYVARFGEIRSAHKILVGKPEGEKLLERCRCMWEDKIKADIKKQGVRMWTRFNCLRIAFGGGFL
jgi:hypothetical protein